MNIYVASSWRNLIQVCVVSRLREMGHEVYDFRNPSPDNQGFSWKEIAPDWENWTPDQYRKALQHPTAERGYKFDKDALDRCDA